MSSTGGNGWGRYEERVLSELIDLKNDVKALSREINNLKQDEISKIKVEVAMLKVKSGLWGAAAGFIPAAVIVALQLAAK